MYTSLWEWIVSHSELSYSDQGYVLSHIIFSLIKLPGWKVSDGTAVQNTRPVFNCLIAAYRMQQYKLFYLFEYLLKYAPFCFSFRELHSHTHIFQKYSIEIKHLIELNESWLSIVWLGIMNNEICNSVDEPEASSALCPNFHSPEKNLQSRTPPSQSSWLKAEGGPEF